MDWSVPSPPADGTTFAPLALVDSPMLNPTTHNTSARRASTRAFTLLELMAVVVIVGVLAAIAIPSAGSAIRERRSAAAANYIVQQYRTARARAMGRGSAVLVRYDTGRVTVREAIAGTNATAGGCNLVTASSCTLPAGRWDTATQYNQIDDFNPTASSSYDGVAFQFSFYTFDPTGTGANATITSNPTLADVCFTPGGRTFARTATGQTAFSELTAAAELRVRMESGSAVIGAERYMYILPNGMARLAI